MLLDGALFLLRRCWNSVAREISFLLVDGNRDRQLDMMISREEKGRGPPKEHISE